MSATRVAPATDAFSVPPAADPSRAGPAAEFAAKGYVVVKDLLSERSVRLVQDRIWTRELEFDDGQARRWHRYKDPLGEYVLRSLRPPLEQIVGLSLYETYSYIAVYPPGADLAPHLDRPACEVSTSLAVANQEAGRRPCSPWPLWLRRPSGDTKVLLDPGDALVYKGCEVEHYRLPLPGHRFSASIFLHYVDADGPHAEHKDDAETVRNAQPDPCVLHPELELAWRSDGALVVEKPELGAPIRVTTQAAELLNLFSAPVRPDAAIERFLMAYPSHATKDVRRQLEGLVRRWQRAGILVRETPGGRPAALSRVAGSKR